MSWSQILASILIGSAHPLKWSERLDLEDIVWPGGRYIPYSWGSDRVNRSDY